MANGPTLRKISIARVKSARLLIDAEDWDGAAQMMGLALECALKAACCKALGLNTYPEKHSDKHIPAFFYGSCI